MLRKQVTLATMECPSEDLSKVVEFWKLFHKAFKEVNGNGVSLNPSGWCTDMNSSCIDGIKTVFGDVTIKGCEVHYKQSVEKRSRSGNLHIGLISKPEQCASKCKHPGSI